MILQRLLANPNVDPLRRRLRTTLSRFDSEYPSISNLSPLIAADPDHGINRPVSDETAYHEVGQVGENAFSALSETLANTESRSASSHSALATMPMRASTRVCFDRSRIICAWRAWRR